MHTQTTLLTPFTGLTADQAKRESIRFGLALIDIGHAFERHPIPGGWVVVSDGKAVKFLVGSLTHHLPGDENMAGERILRID